MQVAALKSPKHYYHHEYATATVLTPAGGAQQVSGPV
jgi:hypothetical protein